MTAPYFPSIPFLPAVRSTGLKKQLPRQCPGWKILAILCCFVNAATADQFGNFSYIDNGSTITITGYPTSAVGEVVIPDTIASKPVTSIGRSAFYNCQALTSVTIPTSVTSVGVEAFYLCRGLTSMTIPSSVTSIGAGAFYTCTGLTSVVIPSSVTSIPASLFYSCSGLKTVTIPSSLISIGPRAFQYCGALTSISVDGANPNFSSLDGVLFNKLQTTLLTFPAGLDGAYVVPASVTMIDLRAFHYCTKLVGVTMSSSLTSIGSLAFYSCSALVHANFTGNAPTIVPGVFDFAASGFAVYYLDSATGFPVPPATTWYGYPAVNMGTNGTPATAWLLSKGFPANSNLQSDSNGDGASLLMAYALNLDPNQNLCGSLPRPVFTANQMSMGFYAATAGVTYTVECSTDFTNWTTNGVTLSAPDANHLTATVNRSGSSCFMRLAVSH